jgi:DNA topoisomerase-1
MEQLHHNGVLVSPNYRGKHLTLEVKEKTIRLTPRQEEMAVAWVKKIGTPYVEDAVFAINFHRDFSEKLDIEIKPGDVDYSVVLRFIEEERARKAKVSKEERKRLTAKRKAQREANREKYGYAWVDGVQMEVANYTAEPSSLFMGRGKHPLRGRWKEGPREKDIELNLSPDSPRPPGDWKDVLWIKEALWIARWCDKLTDKMKYVGLSDSSIIKQRKDIEKFERAKALKDKLSRVQRHIRKNLDANDLKRRKTATVCFLIDKLKLRVGDEKDEDEADTVGASTLRPEHIRFSADNTVTLNFLGKDSIPHVFNIRLPDKVVSNLKNFGSNINSTLFRGVDSKRVSDFLDEAMPGLTAKVFRTYYSSEAVDKKLRTTPIDQADSKHKKKYVASMANLEAAKVCNHRRTIPKTWKTSLEKKKNRLR